LSPDAEKTSVVGDVRARNIARVNHSHLVCMVLATSSPAAAAPASRAIDVQLDPLPFFLRGFAPELGVSWDGHRAFATVIAYDVPGLLAEDDRFEERRDWLIGAGYERFFLGPGRGPFAGASVSVTHSTFTLDRTGGSADTATVKLTVRVGWLLHVIPAVPALFIGPWLGPTFSVAPEEVVVDGERAHRRRIGVIGALQVGWRFSL
jgi:hypothetical protein